MLAQIRRGQQHFAIGATVLFTVGDAHAFETLGDGGVGFVDGDDALARRHHGAGDVGKLFDAHGRILGAAGKVGHYTRTPHAKRALQINHIRRS